MRLGGYPAQGRKPSAHLIREFIRLLQSFHMTKGRRLLRFSFYLPKMLTQGAVISIQTFV